MFRLNRTLPPGLALLGTRVAHACTVCDSKNGHALRAGLFNGSFLHTTLLVFAPVPVFLLAAGAVHRLMPDLLAGHDPATTCPLIGTELQP